ncbi:hypothetical protein ACFY0A_13005 [Streptomyces sp. NPDC001698]|uniref:hypothetical protein n=1 Tax=Streptomyces sp. NPDC001698 TaxID=3364601 RepID=UPI0036C5F966
MSAAATEAEARRRRTRYPVTLAVTIGCYVLAAMAGMFFLTDNVGAVLQILLWIVHGVVLILLIENLGAAESSLYAALFITIVSALCVHTIGMARDDLTLQHRGERVSATVLNEWLDPPQGRKGQLSHYRLEHQDGTRVPGPDMQTTSDLYDVGQVLTVIEDPEGKLSPRTPGQADPTAELLGAGALALATLGSVGWMARRGSDAARRRDRRKKATPEHKARAQQEEQEERLREALRTYPVDRRGYIKVHPEDYPALSQHQAARIAWEMGLRAEAWGNQGSWRFKETVVEEVPLD